MGAHPEALGAEGRDGLVEDLAAAAHDGDLRAVARELGGDLEADAGAPARDQRRLAPQHVRPERRLHLSPPGSSGAGGADGEDKTRCGSWLVDRVAWPCSAQARRRFDSWMGRRCRAGLLARHAAASQMFETWLKLI